MSNPIYVGIVEDQLLFRKGMKAILGQWPEIQVVFESADGYSVIDKLTTCEPKPNVLLVDLSLPPDNGKEFSGVHVTKAVVNTFPEIKILILSVHDDDQFIIELIGKGAHGYLVKESDPNEVYEAIVAVHTKGSYINDKALKALQSGLGQNKRVKPPSPVPIDLTKREVEIISLICQQLTTEEIAEKLFISPKTVNGHRINLLQKTGCNNTAGLVVYAIKNRIVTLW